MCQMIELHVPEGGGEAAAEIAARLDDLVVAYDRIESTRGDSPVGLPAVRDGDRWIALEEVPSYLDELRALLAKWRKYQSDACYVEDDGSTC